MTLRRTLDLHGLTVQLDSLTNFDELFEQLLAKGEESEEVRDERIPYWADLWPSAVALGRYLINSELVKPETSVIEIGCGLGLPGIVAGILGARDVHFTDYLEDALSYAKQNWELNCTHPARFSLLDWRQPDAALAADLVLASDVAYETRFFPSSPMLSEPSANPAAASCSANPDAKSPRYSSTPCRNWDLK
ncbi:MAG: 50S ribosomal protein L11 methyltransferase [Saprospirales bacterium]|nr:50S ribosomal protein L11 methyltransferase [Saprospirales bacterium]